MKKIFLLLGMLAISFLGFAQVSRQQAINSVLNSVVGNNVDNVNVYMEPLPQSDSYYKLSRYDSSLANKCDERLENYDEAIAWYEEILTNPNTSFNDSIFAAIDLGDLYLRLDEGGEKGICGKLTQYKPSSVLEQEIAKQKALSLLPKEFHQQDNDNREFSPVSCLTVEIGINDKIDLVWNMPENDLHRMTISWISSETNGGGSTQAGTDNIFGHLYNHFDLRNHVGWDIDTISFYKTTPWTYSIYVWKQPVGESMQIVHSQLAQISDSIQNAWCSVALDTTITIEENTDYWFGIRATCEEGQATGLCPIPFDDGPAVTGKGDLFMPDLAHWMAMQIGYNAMIKTTLSNASQTGKTSKEQNSCSGYRIYRDGQLIKEIPYSFVTYFTDTEFTKETDVEYCVTAVYGEEESEPVCATATNTGITEKPENDGITVSPNPTDGLVRIEGVEVAEMQVYNALGQLVKFAQNSNEINLRDLPQGVYSLRITGDKGEITSKKIVVE